MRLVVIFAIALAVSPATLGAESASAGAADERPSADRVRELLVLSGAPRQAELLADQLIQTFRKSNPAVHPAFWEEIKASFGSGQYVDLIVPVYQKHLSAQDVEAAIAYWKSDTGRRFSEAQPAIMAESAQVGREWGAKVYQAVTARLKAAPARKLFTGYIDRTGKVVIEPRFDRVDSFSDGMAMVDVWR